MDDMNAFERQVVGQIHSFVGPSRPVNDAAIFSAISATQSLKWRFGSMFSATKFVLAGAIVALFGGFLLAGVLTQPSEEQGPGVGESASATAALEATAEVTSDVLPTPADDTSEASEATTSVGSFDTVPALAEVGGPHTATLLEDGRVLLVAARDAWVWDPATGALDPAGSLGTPRSENPVHRAVRLTDGRVLIFGGDDWGTTAVEIWDPPTESFSPAGEMSECCGANPTGTLLPSGSILIARGEFGGPERPSVWDPTTQSFIGAAPLVHERTAHTATPLTDGTVLLIGGAGADPEAEVFDPRTMSFREAGSLVESRAFHTATLLPDGRILVVGGGEGGGGGALDSAEVWDPATESFSPTGSLLEARTRHTATLLADGRVLVVGGSGPRGALTSAEIWDPETGVFELAGSLQDAAQVRNHTATRLPDGRVLLVSDGGAAVWTPVSAEPAVDAATNTPDLLPGVDLVTEEVEPGVYRVLSDGIRDLARPLADYDYSFFDVGISAGRDGSVWVHPSARSWRGRPVDTPKDHELPFRLGESVDPRIDDQTSDPDGVEHDAPLLYGNASVRADGTLFVVADGIWNFAKRPDDDAWQQWPDAGWLYALADDGSAWTVRDALGTTMLGRTRDGSTFDSVPVPWGFVNEPSSLWVTLDGDVWLRSDAWFVSYDGADWQRWQSPIGGGGPADVGPDGTLWTSAVECEDCRALARFDGTEWTEYGESDGVPPMGGYEMPAVLDVAPDGSVWVNSVPKAQWQSDDGTVDTADAIATRDCGGAHRFDGTTWQRHLDGTCVYDLDIAPDGTVWLRGGTFDLDAGEFGSVTGPVEVYAITPEAAAATE